MNKEDAPSQSSLPSTPLSTTNRGKGLLAAIGDKDYPISASLITQAHVANDFVKRADSAWRQCSGALIGKASLPRMPADTVQQQGGLVAGLLSNVVRSMKLQSQADKKAGTVMEDKRRPVLLIRTPEQTRGWLIARALFRPFSLSGIQLEVGSDTDRHTSARLKFDVHTKGESNLCLPTMDTMGQIQDAIENDMASAAVSSFTYTMPSYDLDWMHPLENIWLRTGSSVWTSWSQSDLDALGNQDGDDDSDSGGDSSDGDEGGHARRNGLMETHAALRFLRSLDSASNSLGGLEVIIKCFNEHF